MEVILLKDVAKVGKRFDIVTVADGHALHFLIPQGLAQAATPAARAMRAAQQAKASERKGEHDAAIAKSIGEVNGKMVTLSEKANEQGHLFASLHVEKIVSVLYDQLGATIPLEYIRLEHPIKEIGKHEIPLLSGEVHGSVTLNIEAQK